MATVLLLITGQASWLPRARADGDSQPGWATPSQASTHEPAESGPYAELIEDALREYRAHRFHEARSLFAKAHAVLPNARTLRGLGLVEFELRNYVESAALLERALAEPERALTDALRSETEQLWQRAEGFVARFELRSEQTLSVRVDGVARELRVGEPLAVAVGDHLLEFSAPDHVPERRVVRVRGGEREPLQVALARSDTTSTPRAQGAQPLETAAPTAGSSPPTPDVRVDLSPAAAARSELSEGASGALPATPPAPRRDDAPLHKNKWIWTGVGVATAALAVGLGFGLTAERASTRDPISAPPIASRSGP